MKENTGSSQEQQGQNRIETVKTEDMEPEEVAEKQILQEEEEKIKKATKNILSQDIEYKLEQIYEDIKQDEGKDFQTIITLRMKELAYNKILVLTYERPQFRLVLAHFHIAKEYLKFKCYEQALHHLQTAIDKNVKTGDSMNVANKLYHSYLLTYMGEALYFSKSYQEAFRNLEKALNLQTQYHEKERSTPENTRTHKLFALVKAKLKHEDASQYMQKTVQRAKKSLQNGKIPPRAFGLILYEQGKLQLSSNHIQTAINLYKEAIHYIEKSTDPDKEEDVIKIYQELANIQEKLDPQIYIQTLKDKFQVFEDSYGNADKRSLKEQRNLVTALIKYQKIEEALEQSEDILEKQKRVYGENSLEVGKELRTIGNIYIAKQDSKQAEVHFKKACKIFHDLGDKRQVRQLTAKINSIQFQQQ